jgi:hypothetical protein
VFRPLQPRPDEQVPVPPAPQQIWPAAPQAAHWLPPVATTQLRPVVQDIWPGQQGCPAPPQAEQVPPPPSTWPPHTKPDWQPPPPQQDWPAPPQFWQVPGA